MARLCPYFIQLLQTTDAKDSSLLPKTLPSLSALTLYFSQLSQTPGQQQPSWMPTWQHPSGLGL